MSDVEAVQTVAGALSALEDLKRQQEEQHRAHIAELDAEIERIRQAVANMTAQLEAVQQSRVEAEANLGGREQELAAEGYTRIFGALKAQASQLSERTVAWTEASRALAAKRNAAMQEDEFASLVQEYEAFQRDMLPNLENFPASYRDVLQGHHDQVTTKLKERMEGLQGLPEVDGDNVRLDVVTAVDADAEGGIVMVVMPVAEEVNAGWSQRDADLQTRVAARVIEGVYRSLRGGALEGLQAMSGGHQGLLALEVELPAGHAEGFDAKLNAALNQALESAEDLNAAKLTLEVTSVAVDLLLPPEDEEGDDA